MPVTPCRQPSVGRRARTGTIQGSGRLNMNRSNRSSVIYSPSSDSADLTHLIYDTALDNSLWPEMILRVYEEFERLENDRPSSGDDLRDLQNHFVRGLQISERLNDLQESNDVHRRFLDRLSLRVWLFDAQGALVGEDAGEQERIALQASSRLLPPELMEEHGQKAGSAIVVSSDSDQFVTMLFGPDQIAQFGLPRKVQWAMFQMDRDPARIAANVARKYALSTSRRCLLEAFLRHTDLREAAEQADLSYETARTYIKEICKTVGVSGQRELLKTILLDPGVVVPDIAPWDAQEKQRRRFSRPDGSQLEYFTLGDEAAYPIIHFDALTGGALDILKYPDRYLPVLNRLNARLIIPCRPGTFGTGFRAQESARDYAREVEDICNQLEIERFSLLAYSYGSVSALGVAHEMSERVDRVVLASVCYPDYIAPDWHSMDFFYQVSRVIGRRWPGLLRRVIPFLCKSILQNIDNFSDRAAARADCPHEEALLMEPMIRVRSRAMLEDRIAQGMEGLVQEYQIIARKLDFDIASLQVPLMLFHGDCDRINPLGGAEALAKDAPQAKLTTLADRGHAFIYAEWEWLLAAAAGEAYEIPPATRRGILKDAV